MKPFIKDIKLHFVTLLIFGIVFPLIIWLFSLGEPTWRLAIPSTKMVKLQDLKILDKISIRMVIFGGRPLAVNYNAAATGGSNKISLRFFL